MGFQKQNKRVHKKKRALDYEEQQYKREKRITKKLKIEEHALEVAARQDRKLAAQQTVDPEAVAQALKHQEISAYDRLLGALGVANTHTEDEDEVEAEPPMTACESEPESELSGSEEDEEEEEEEDEEESSSSEDESCASEGDAESLHGLESFDSEGKAEAGSEICTNFRSAAFSRILVKGAAEHKVRELLSGGNFRSHKQMNEAELTEVLAGEEGRVKEVGGVISEYMDAVIPANLWEVTAAHVASHVLRTRDLVIGNKEDAEKGDSGFSRTRVLVLSATRSLADRWIRKFLEMLDEKRTSNVRGMDKYERKFLAGEVQSKVLSGGGREAIFAGNTDDNFRLGISVSKRSVKLMTSFETSDIIVASPLGLSVVEEITDHLSSLEVVVLDQADLFRFQNWEHVVRVLDAANKKPKTLNGCDISRLRQSFLDDRQRVYRQTIVTSDRPVTEMLSVFDDRWKFPATVGNFRGRVIFSDEIADSLVLNLRKELGVHRQIFLSPRCNPKSGEISDPRLDLLRDKFWPEVGRELTRLVICVSDYFAFLRVRKYFKDETEARLVQVSEFSSDRKLRNAREAFETGEKPVLLVTERLLWFKPLKLKNVQHVLFFGVPEFPAHYEHLVRRCTEPVRANVVTIFTPDELNQLERIVGTSEIGKVLPSMAEEGSACPGTFLPKMAVFT